MDTVIGGYKGLGLSDDDDDESRNTVDDRDSEVDG